MIDLILLIEFNYVSSLLTCVGFIYRFVGIEPTVNDAFGGSFVRGAAILFLFCKRSIFILHSVLQRPINI